jgi:hypothetical protein
MPIPSAVGQDEQEYISSCIKEVINEYDSEGQAYAVCKSTWDKENMKKEVSEEAQQGGVVGTGFARTKFEFVPKAKEKMNDFMSRCMSDSLVKERKPSRVNRAGFCYSEYQNRYIMTIGQKWS